MMKTTFLLYAGMMKIIVEAIYAVGMHHHGSRSLEVGSGYKVLPEPTNRFDPNALAICDIETGSVKAYIKRADAMALSIVLRQFNIRAPIMLKPKFEPVFRRGGPVQRCNIGFYCQSEDAENVLRILKDSGLFAKCI
jgi:hypothetical protein